MRVPSALPPGDLVDLGCGAGNAAGPLAGRWPDRAIIGVDRSPVMLGEARALGCYTGVIEADIARWHPATPPALIFSNAALQWVPDHAGLLPRLSELLAPRGVLAVQMPDQQDAPSHRLLRDVAARRHPDLFDWRDWAPEVLAPDRIHDLLAGLGRLEVWQTVYHQHLPACTDGHPVRRFTESTAARPVLAHLPAGARDGFLAAYDAALDRAYPRLRDGSVLFPFTRLFFVLERRQ